jgi:hypothetical protein
VTREGVEAKARRYVSEGRLNITRVRMDSIAATCRGSDAFYWLGWEEGGWWCSCPARARCSHLVALQLVTVRPEPRESGPEPGEPAA